MKELKDLFTLRNQPDRKQMMLIKNAKEALQMVSNNEAIINGQENQTLQEKIKSDITEGTKDTVKKYMAKDSLKTYKIDQGQEH